MSLRQTILALLENEAIDNGRSVKAVCTKAKVPYNSVLRLFKRTVPVLETLDKLLAELGWEIKLVRKGSNGPRTDS